MANLGSIDTPIAGESFGLPSGWALVENGDGEIVIEDSGRNVVFRRDETAGKWITDSIDAESVGVGSTATDELNDADFSEAEDGEAMVSTGDGKAEFRVVEGFDENDVESAIKSNFMGK